MWNVARTDAQILAAYEQTVDLNEEGLRGYWRFDAPLGSETHTIAEQRTGFSFYDTKLVIRHDGNDYVEPQHFIDNTHDPEDIPVNGIGEPFAIPVCFCENPPDEDSCTVSRVSAAEQPLEAITSQTSDQCNQDTQTCVFVHGDLINPNGALGKLWLPGVCSSSGPRHNRTERFIPGRFEEC